MISNSLAAGLLDLLLQNINFSNVGDATGLQASSTAGSLYVSLHTAYPGQGGAQNTSEASFTNYARQAIARSSSGWTRSIRTVTNDNIVSFPAAGNSVAEVITHWGIGTASSGAGVLLFSGPIKRTSGSVLIGTGKASDDTLTIPGHSLSVNDKIGILQVAGQTLPAGLTDGVNVFVKTVSGDVITVSATSGGSTLDITAAGVCWVVPTVSISVVEPIQPQLNASAISIRF